MKNKAIRYIKKEVKINKTMYKNLSHILNAQMLNEVQKSYEEKIELLEYILKTLQKS